MASISFHQSAHSFDVHLQNGEHLFGAHFQDAAQAISFAAEYGLISGVDAQVLIAGGSSMNNWVKSVSTHTEDELLKIGFRKLN